MLITQHYLESKYSSATIAYMRGKVAELFVDKPDYRKKDSSQQPIDGEYERSKPEQFMLFMGGGNASGKTTLMNVMKQRGVLNREAIERGDIIQINNPLGMTGVESCLQFSIAGPQGEILKEGIAARERHYWEKGEDQGIDFASMIVDEALRRGLCVTVDTHFRQADRYLAWVEEARTQNIPTILYGVTISPETYIKRVEARNRLEGRPILYKFQLDRHAGFSQNWNKIIPHFDVVALFDNENTVNADIRPGMVYKEGVATDGSLANEGGHRLIALGARDATSAMQLKVYPGAERNYQEFLAKADIPVSEFSDDMSIEDARTKLKTWRPQEPLTDHGPAGSRLPQSEARSFLDFARSFNYRSLP